MQINKTNQNINFLYWPKITFTDYRLYLVVFVVSGIGILAPFIFHLFNLGNIFLPLYFIILITSYIFGWRAGILVASFSPVINFALIGMPQAMILPFVIIKGLLLVLASDFLLNKTENIKFIDLISIVAIYQILGTLISYLFSRNISMSLADIIHGYPGILLQIIGGYMILKFYERKELDRNKTSHIQA